MDYLRNRIYSVATQALLPLLELSSSEHSMLPMLPMLEFPVLSMLELPVTPVHEPALGHPMHVATMTAIATMTAM